MHSTLKIRKIFTVIIENVIAVIVTVKICEFFFHGNVGYSHSHLRSFTSTFHSHSQVGVIPIPVVISSWEVMRSVVSVHSSFVFTLSVEQADL